LRRKRLLQFSFKTIFPLEDFGEERRRERICRQIEREKKKRGGGGGGGGGGGRRRRA